MLIRGGAPVCPKRGLGMAFVWEGVVRIGAGECRAAIDEPGGRSLLRSHIGKPGRRSIADTRTLERARPAHGLHHGKAVACLT